MKVERSKENLIYQLEEQLNFLKASSHLFDIGVESEAKRIALTLRILLHDTKNSKSLLTHLEIKDKLWFYDCFEKMEENCVFCITVGVMSTPNGLKYVPNLFKPKFKVNFDDWWNQIIIFQKNPTPIKYTKKDVILSVADTDGGAHVDDKLPQNYYNLIQNKALPDVKIQSSLGEGTTNNAMPSIIRQCAHEIELSLKEQSIIWKS